MTEPGPSVDLSPIGICCALWVVARIAAVAQGHCGMDTGICTPHAWAVFGPAAHERLTLGGRSTHGGNACGGMQPEQVTNLCYGP